MCDVWYDNSFEGLFVYYFLEKKDIAIFVFVIPRANKC